MSMKVLLHIGRWCLLAGRFLVRAVLPLGIATFCLALVPLYSTERLSHLGMTCDQAGVMECWIRPSLFIAPFVFLWLSNVAWIPLVRYHLSRAKRSENAQEISYHEEELYWALNLNAMMGIALFFGIKYGLSGIT